MISNTRAVSKLIRQAEDILLTGGQHLNGRQYRVEEDAKEKKDASIAIVQAYSVLKELGGSHPCCLRRIGYVARDIVGHGDYADYVFRVGETPEAVQQVVRRIAEEARAEATSEQIDRESRVKNGRLFVVSSQIFPVSIRDSKRGCSASICSNCFEPIAYATMECSCCKMELVGPFGFPEIEEWRGLTLRQKRVLAADVFAKSDHGKLGVIESGGKRRVPVFAIQAAA